MLWMDSGNDFVVVGKKSKRKNISISEESDDEFIPSSKIRETKRSCNRPDSREQRPKQRLSRDEKQFNRALDHAIAESKSSQQDGDTPSSKSDDQESRVEEDSITDAEEPQEESDSDFSSQDQSMDSDDDFQPAVKTNKASSKTSKASSKSRKTNNTRASRKPSATKGGGSVVKSGKAKVSGNGVEASAVRSTNTVQKTQLPGAKKSSSVTAASGTGSNAGNSATVEATSRAGSGVKKSSRSGLNFNMLPISPATTSGQSVLKAPGLCRVGNSPSVRTGGAPIRTGGGPVIRVGLSRRAPVKQLHKHT